MKKIQQLLVLVFLSTCLSTGILAQNLNHVLGDVLVQPEDGQRMELLLTQLQSYQNTPTKLSISRKLSGALNIWLLNFDYVTVDEYKFVDYLNNFPGIEVAQRNHLVNMRQTIPNDPQFNNQWQYINTGNNGGVVDADIDADLAWDITTGGLTADGDTIVAAVLDDGIDNHEDFGSNLWVNYAEIPDNDIDDDNNGYVDDYRGWSIVTDDDNLNGGGHGTPVAGIIGAKGDNGVGVTGVNWNVKVMVIKNNFNTDEAAVLEAYSYPLLMRRKYNETDGAEGAFVVSTNASWGVNFGQPDNAPLWCAFYDTLGVSGILNCGATANLGIDIDVDGDLPTACPSDYMVAVTNVNRSDNKVNGAGYGATTIDLGAFGADAYTTADNNSYGGFGGTSGATPHVTGAIALLYSAPCPNLIALAKADPAAAALQVKQYIMEGTDPNTSLAGITVSGGRLNIFNSLQLIMNNCGPCPPPSSLSSNSITPFMAQLTWNPGVNANFTDLRYREVGAANWIEVANLAGTTYDLDNLLSCTEYEFQVKAICTDENSDYTNSHVFTTAGCCDAPDLVEVTNVGSSSAMITWNNILAAESYNILLTGNTDQVIITGYTETSIMVNDLQACETYQVIIQTVCNGTVPNPSVPVSFTTLGCGACLDFTYCAMEGEDAGDEWIASVSIGDINNTSGSDDGYGDFSGTSTDMAIGSSHALTLTPGYSGGTFNERFKIWIDFNQDGDFEDTDELAFDSGTGSSDPATGTITVPSSANVGLTRMRIAMRWTGGGNNQEPQLCEDPNFGEVEDYCVNITEGVAICQVPTGLDTLSVGVSGANMTWDTSNPDHDSYNLRYSKATQNDWTEIPAINPPYAILGLDDCELYEVQLQGNCLNASTSEYSSSMEFSTLCILNTNNLEDLLRLSVVPNPFQEVLNIQYNQLSSGPLDLQLFTSTGKMIYSNQKEQSSGPQNIQLDHLGHLPSGVYLLRLKVKEGEITKRVIKF